MAIKHTTLRRHVVAIPYPAQGHITPMLQLCEHLAPLGFTFTFINTHHIHLRLLRAGHLHPASYAYHCVHGTHHVHDSHVHDPLHNEAAQVPQSHQDEDGRGIRTSEAAGHGRQDVVANDADHGKDADADAHDVCGGDDVGTHDVYLYKGCSSIRMMFIAGGCAPEQHAHISTESEAFKAAQEMCEPVEHTISHIMEEQAVQFMMSDILLGWSSATADKFGLRWVSFWAGSAASLSAIIYISDLVDRGETIIPDAEMEAEEAPMFEGIPGLPPTRCDEVLRMWDAQGKVYEEACKYFKAAVEQASMVLVNTFEAVEGQVLEALSTRFRIGAVGPLLPSRFMHHTHAETKEEEGFLLRPSLFAEDSSCLGWLDTQAPSSVLFISFGSISLRSYEQLQELALGIQASGCPFLWVCKPDISNGLDNNRFNHLSTSHPSAGLVVPWAPQLQVLSHPSVGGFVTHCGWNSVIESLSMGVPMLCWADTGERMSNQRFVVKFWKCGIDMVADKRRTKQHIDEAMLEAMLVGRDDVEKSVRFLMLEEGGASIRVQSTKIRKAAIKAYEDSHSKLNEFVDTMNQRCHHLEDSNR